MTLNVDWFSMWGQRQNTKSRTGSGFDDPNWHSPHDRLLDRDLDFNWIFPQAASLSQLIVSNYDFLTSDGGPNEQSTAILSINGSLITQKLWNRADRFADRGSVWDLNITVQQGDEVSMRFRQQKGSTTNSNDFVTSITGTWLRDI